MSMTSLTFDPPGPGSWSIDAVHFARPFSRFQAEVHPPNLAAGFTECMKRYGLLLETLEYAVVNGFAYSTPRPAPASEIPERFEAAARAFETRLWREDIARWDREVKPASIRDHLRLQKVDERALSDEALLDHIDACREHLQRMVRQHHSFNAAAILPIGDFMAHVAEWTTVPLGTALAALRGAAPESAGSFPALDRLVDAMRGDPAAKALLNGVEPPGAILDRLQATPGPIGEAATDYLEIVGFRLLDSLDTGDSYALEVPRTLVDSIRRAVDDGAPVSSEAPKSEIAALRERIPVEHREAFDDLLTEARLMSRMRDERGLYSDIWAGGIARKALLEGGRRLVAKGRIREPGNLIEASYDEIRDLLKGSGGPSADELAQRANYRATARASEAPPLLGDPPHPPPPLDGLPPPVARAMRALGMAVNSLFAPSPAVSDATVVRGTGASPGIYTGVARVLSGPIEFVRLQKGDVLVTATTTEAFNIVLPMIGAIVTDNGGLLSHAAIVSREYGIPGVVGCRDATRRIKDGARIEVNGGTGEIRVLAT